MGLSFLSLLYLQVSYIEEMMKTRKEQFDSAVRNSLDQVSKDVEYAETRRWLIEDISEAERKALIANNKTPPLVCKFNKKLNLFLAFFYLF